MLKDNDLLWLASKQNKYKIFKIFMKKFQIIRSTNFH